MTRIDKDFQEVKPKAIDWARWVIPTLLAAVAVGGIIWQASVTISEKASNAEFQEVKATVMRQADSVVTIKADVTEIKADLKTLVNRSAP